MPPSQVPTQPPADYSDDGPGMIASCSVLAFLALLVTAAVILRFWARRLTCLGLGLDDYLALSALIAHHGILAGYIAGVIIGGLGQDIRITLKDNPDAIKFLFKVSPSIYSI